MGVRQNIKKEFDVNVINFTSINVIIRRENSYLLLFTVPFIFNVQFRDADAKI
mgnify:CR=1 FL=1